MDRSLDEIVAERQRSGNRGGRRTGPPPRRNNNNSNNDNNNYPRDGVRKPVRNERANLDNDWVHDRYDDEPSAPRNSGSSRPRGRRDERRDDYSPEREKPLHAKLRVDNLHYDLTEDDIYDLFTRIAPVLDAKLKYDRAGRSEGVAFVSYENVADARTAIREFDGANAKGQPIRLALLPPPRRDNPFNKVENPRSLFDRIQAPNGRERRRSQSPMEDLEDDRRGYRLGPRRGTGPRDRRSDMTKPPPENIDRYVPGESGERSSSHRGGRRPGERRERAPRGREEGGPRTANGRPRKTQEELDAEMDDYWGSAGTNQAETTTKSTAIAPATQTSAAPATTTIADDDIDMIE